MHGARAAVLRPRRVVIITVRRCVGKMPFIREMQRVFEDLPYSWDERRQEQDGDSDGENATHQGEI